MTKIIETKFVGIFIMKSVGGFFIVDDNGNDKFFNHCPNNEDVENYRKNYLG